MRKRKQQPTKDERKAAELAARRFLRYKASTILVIFESEKCVDVEGLRGRGVDICQQWLELTRAGA